MSKTAEKERIYWIDWTKSLAIALVVWAHISLFLKKEIFLFHMPFFFLISGYLYHRKGMFEEAKSILFSLVVPYLIYNILYILPLPLGGEFKHDTIQNILLGNQERLCYVMQPMWFIVSLIMMRLSCMLSIKIEWIGIASLLLSVLLGGVDGLQNNDYFQWRTTLLCFPFFCVGYVLRKYEIINKISINKVVSIVICVLVLLGGVFVGMFNSEHWTNGLNVFHCRIGKSIVLFYLVAFAISISFMCLCQLLLNVQCIIIERLSKGTLFILAFHLPIFWRIPHFYMPDLMNQFLSLLVIMFVSYVGIMLSQKYCPALLGRRLKR